MADNKPWASPNKWPMDFQNFQFLFRATLLLGKALFADEWTGDECKTELIPLLPQQPPTGHTSISIMAYQRLRIARPDLQLKPIKDYSQAIDWTPELWREAHKLYKTLNEQTVRQSRRFAYAKNEIFVLLRDGKLKSYLRPKNGGQFSKALDASSWNTERWGTRFTAGMMNPKDPFSVGFAGDDFQYIFVDAEDLRRCIDGLNLKQHVPAESKTSQISPQLSNQGRWGILPTLVWIATRDIVLASNSAANGKSFSRENIGLTIVRAAANQEGALLNWPLLNLDHAWKHELAPMMADGKIKAFATRVLLSKIGGLSQNTPGVVFPPTEAPGASLEHFIDDNNTSVAIIPNGKPFAHTWNEWHDATFPRATVQKLWPAIAELVQVAPLSTARHSDSPDLNIGQCILWIDSPTKPCHRILKAHGPAAILYPGEEGESLQRRLLDSKKALWEKLGEGNLRATRIELSGTRIQVSQTDWQDLDLPNDGSTVADILFHKPSGKLWSGFSIRRSELQQVFSAEKQFHTLANHSILEATNSDSVAQDHPTLADSPAIRQTPNKTVSDWFEQYQEQGLSLTRDAIEAAGRAKFGERVTVTRLRKLYRSIAPNGGNKRGRKAKARNSAS